MHAAQLLTRRAALSPDREALLDAGSGIRYSYAELNARANQMAHWLQAQGIRVGDRVSLLAHNSVLYVDLLYACGKIGAVFTPLNWRLVAVELDYIVNDCAPQLLIVGPAFTELAAAMTAVFPRWTVADVETAVLQQPTHNPPVPAGLTGESTYCILYTSGTTGRPKGALIPHRQVLWNAINTVISWGLTAVDSAPIFTPMFHAGGLFVFLTPLFYVGGHISIMREFDTTTSLRLIADAGCTVILGVPTIFQMWLAHPVLAEIDLSQVRWFISGGAPCPPALIKQWQARTGVALRQGYGLTEVGTNCFSMSNMEARAKVGSVGRPIFHSEMRLVDRKGQDVPRGETGELIIRGPHVCTGYLNSPEATAAALQDGWFYTGDMAHQDEEGYFYISGRYKDMIISGGENVYAAEVETVLLTHPDVADCALIGVPDPKWGEVGLMVTVLHSNASADEATLRDFCRQRLAAYKVPRRVIFVAELPYSPYGKVMKLELKQQYVQP